MQDKTLKTVQEELTLTRLSAPVASSCTLKNGWWITNEYKYQSGIVYHKKYTLNWLQCVENRTKKMEPNTPHAPPPKEESTFEYVTNIMPDKENASELCSGGRLRWKIENEGFNTQKNDGYELEHKYCRKSYNGLQNYYSLLQIAHAINQLIEKGKWIVGVLKLRPKETLINLWRKLKSYFIFCKPMLSCMCGQNDNGFMSLFRPALE